MDDMKPDKMGEATQEATILRMPIHLMEDQPRKTMEKPIVAPTIECVPEMGILSAVAIKFHAAEPVVINVSKS